jgi:hypothetical protein
VAQVALKDFNEKFDAVRAAIPAARRFTTRAGQ